MSVHLLPGDILIVCTVCVGAGRDSSGETCILCWSTGSFVRRLTSDRIDVELACTSCARVHTERVPVEMLVARTWIPEDGWTIVHGPWRPDGAVELSPKAICASTACLRAA